MVQSVFRKVQRIQEIQILSQALMKIFKKVKEIKIIKLIVDSYVISGQPVTFPREPGCVRKAEPTSSCWPL